MKSKESKSTDDVKVTTQLSGLGEEIKEHIQSKVSNLENRLNSSDAFRTLLVNEPFELLGREGLLQNAKEVKFTTSKEDLSSLSAVQAMTRRSSNRSKGLGIVVQVCITVVIVIRRVQVQITICITKAF